MGELASLRQAALPIAGAVGGMFARAAIYAASNTGGEGAAGWGIPMATDIAFALAGDGHPSGVAPDRSSGTVILTEAKDPAPVHQSQILRPLRSLRTTPYQKEGDAITTMMKS